MYLGGMGLRREETSWAHSATIPAQRRHQRIPGCVRGVFFSSIHRKWRPARLPYCVCVQSWREAASHAALLRLGGHINIRWGKANQCLPSGPLQIHAFLKPLKTSIDHFHIIPPEGLGEGGRDLNHRGLCSGRETLIRGAHPSSCRQTKPGHPATWFPERLEKKIFKLEF